MAQLVEENTFKVQYRFFGAEIEEGGVAACSNELEGLER